jgi:hypothetical protein
MVASIYFQAFGVRSRRASGQRVISDDVPVFPGAASRYSAISSAIAAAGLLRAKGDATHLD